MGRRVSYNYGQLAIGDCGHVCQMWPQIHRLGNPADRVEVICPTCTLAAYGLDAAEDVWVFVREPDVKVKPAVSRARKPAVKKVTCSVCRKQGHMYAECPLLTGQEVLDGT